MNSDVKVTIDLTKPIGKVGFGVPLILEASASKGIAYTECSSLADVVTAGFANTTAVYKAANAIFMQDDAPAKIAVCATSDMAETWLGEVENTNKDWRQLVVVSSGEPDVAGIMATVETLDNKIYFANLSIEDATSFSVDGIEKTVLFYCDPTGEYPSPVSALVGATAGSLPGSLTYKNMILKGIAPQNLTVEQLTAIHEKGGISFVTKAGDNVTSEGKVAGGEYIDIVDSKDYVCYNIEYKVQKLLNVNKKISFDNKGIAMIETTVVSVLKDAYDNGMIATNDDGTPAYSVTALSREEVSETDRVVRKYKGLQFKFKLAGAIHDVAVVGEILI